MADEKILDRIQALLNKAQGTNNPHEREAFQAKADQMMAGHQIEEAALRARNVARGLTEVKLTVPIDEMISWVSDTDEFMPVHRQNAVMLAELAGVRIVFVHYGKLHVIGYPDAVGYFKMLWISTHLTFSGQLDPKWNKNATPGENIRAFIEAGYKWDYVWHQARKEGQPFTRVSKGETIEVACPPKDNGWMKRQVAKAYAATGEEKPQLNHAVKNFRNSFALGFAEQLGQRVTEMLIQRRRMEMQAEGGAQLVLKKDVDALGDYFRKLYPPGTLGAGRAQRLSGNHQGAAARGRTAAAMADLSGGRGGVSGAPRKALG